MVIMFESETESNQIGNLENKKYILKMKENHKREINEINYILSMNSIHNIYISKNIIRD
jgi:hypothetical protein